MSWIWAHRRIGRAIGGVLLLVALLGPWAYEADAKPPVELCHAPDFVLNGRCVGLVSGATIVSYVARVFFEVIVGLASGVRVLGSERGAPLREFLFLMLPVLILAPCLSTLALMRTQESNRRRILHLVALAPAIGLSLLLAATLPALSSSRFWGLWLYIGLTAGMLIIEGSALVIESRVQPGQ